MTFVVYRAARRVGVVLVVAGVAAGAFRLTAYVVDRAVFRSIRRSHRTGDDDW